MANLLVHVNRSLDSNTWLKLVAGSLSAEEPSQDRLENQAEGLLCRLRHVHYLEVPHKAGCQWLASTTWRGGRAHHSELLNLLPREALPVIESILVNELA